MNYKLESIVANGKKKLILFIILWLVIIILGVAPFSAAITEANAGAAFNSEIFFEKLGTYISSPFSSFGVVLSTNYIGTFGKGILYFTIFFALAAVIGLLKAAPKNEYTDIEHGSSDWSTGGEEYRVLSKHKGILLAQDHYLPIDKRGNINVLVVGRFRFW